MLLFKTEDLNLMTFRHFSKIRAAVENVGSRDVKNVIFLGF